MALTVEDGSIIEDADSYIGLDDARTMAENYGYSLPDDDTECEVALRKGALYIDSFESRYPGSRTDDSQELAWPRENAAYNYGTEIDDDAIPSKLQFGQVIAAATYGDGTDVRPNDTGRAISKEIVGPIDTEYFNNGTTSEQITITEAVDALKCLFTDGSSNIYSFRVGRG